MKHIKDVIVSRMEERGLTFTTLSRKTGIKYYKINKSLSRNQNRPIYSNELLAICKVLELTLADFDIDNTTKE